MARIEQHTMGIALIAAIYENTTRSFLLRFYPIWVNNGKGCPLCPIQLFVLLFLLL